MSLWERIIYEFNKNSSPVRKLIIINVGVFILTSIVFAFAKYNAVPGQADKLLSVFYLPSDFALFIKKPWTVVSYMFLHVGFRHILGNLILLYLFGRILIDFQPAKTFYTIFFGGGIAGGVLFMIMFNLFPSYVGGGGLSNMVGASGGVVAIAVATAILVPNYEVNLFGAFRLKVKWIALYLVVVDVLFFGNGNQGGHLAHMGGALFGALYILNLQGRIQFGFFKRVRSLFKPKYTIIDEREILKDRKKSPRKKTVKSTVYNVHSSNKPRQEEVDAILDKIGQSGYDSLSKEEKELLFRASE